MATWPDDDNQPFRVVLIADGQRATAARQAIATAGGRLIAEADWSDPLATLDRVVGERPVVMIDTVGVAAAVLEAALPRIDAAVAAVDLPIVALLDQDGIDLVAAMLVVGDVELLCEASAAECVMALAISGRLALALPAAKVREGEAERLRRLSDEVARIAAVLARLATRDEPGPEATDVADRRRSFDAGPATAVDPLDPRVVRQAIRARRMRDMFFGDDLFEDPAWDMLLDLFAAELEGSRVSVSSLCIAAAVAPTTALRWIGRLTDAGLFERHPDPADRRRAFMALSAKATMAMRAYWESARRAGLAIV